MANGYSYSHYGPNFVLDISDILYNQITILTLDKIILIEDHIPFSVSLFLLLINI